MHLLQSLCEIFSPSGNESGMKNFLINYVEENKHTWKVQPEIVANDSLQDCLILRFGKPKTAILAHMDTIGFTVRYQDQLIPIGGPEAKKGYKLVGHDTLGPIFCELVVTEKKKDRKNQLSYKFARGIERGTELVFESNFKETKKYIQSCYLDNRVGIYNTLKVAETLEHGIIAYTCWEEHGGGSVPYISKYIYENYGVRQCLVSDVTWITDGIFHGDGVAVSMRDRNIPRRSYINKIIQLAEASGIPFQLEVEGEGSSDGRELQTAPYPFDWCFIGTPIANAHSPKEKVHKNDLSCMVELYQYLMKNL